MMRTSLALRSGNLFRYAKRIETLGKYFLQTPFSSKSFRFSPTKNDWKIIRKLPRIQINLTNRCNSSCKICYTNSTPFDYSKELSKEEIASILRKVGRGKRVVLIGGEPTVREDLFEIIKIVRKFGGRPELYTNGLKLSNANYVKKLKELGIKRVYFSFDGFRKEIYEKMTGRGEELFLKLLGLKNLETFGIEVIISARIAKGLNEDEIKKLIDFCVESVRKGGNIRGAYFYGATHYGRFLLKDAEIYTLELVDLVERATDYQVELDYLIENKKLALNLFKLFYKWGFSIPFGSGGLVGLYKAGSIKKLYPTSFIRKVNKYFEKGKSLRALYELVKNKDVRKILMGVISGKDLLEAIGKSGIFIIGIGNVHTPLNYRPYLYDSVEFEKSPKSGLPIVNEWNYSRPEAL